MSRKSAWSRADKWTATGVVVAVIAILIGLFVPEIRRKIGLEKSADLPSTIAPNLEGASPPPVSKPQITQGTNAKGVGRNNIIGNSVKGDRNIVGDSHHVSTAPPPAVQINNAPNGIAIGGGIVNNPTVYNFGSPPAPPPTITMCISESTVPEGQHHDTIFKLLTDVKISQPWYAFFFDGPVLEGSAGMDGHGFGYTHGRAEKLPNPENSFLFRLTAIDFGTNTWAPGQEIKITVPSANPVHLVRILSGSEENGLNENIVFHCNDN